MKEQKKKTEKDRKRQKKLEIKRMKSQKLKELSAPIAVMRELPGVSKKKTVCIKENLQPNNQQLAYYLI
jgi:hypothetical protein